MTDWVKPEYCINPDTPCDTCNFFWRDVGVCSLMPDEELTNKKLRDKRKPIKTGGNFK